MTSVVESSMRLEAEVSFAGMTAFCRRSTVSRINRKEAFTCENNYRFKAFTKSWKAH